MLGLGKLRGAIRHAGAGMPTEFLRALSARIGGVKVASSARLGRGAKISRGCEIGPFCRVGEETVLEDLVLSSGCTIGDFARLAHLSAGEGTHIETDVLCIGARPGRITIGRHCYIGVGALLDFSSDLAIGDFVHIAGPTAAIHTHSSVPMTLKGCRLDQDGRQYGQVRIGSHTWIGGNAAVYPGTTIGDHCVVLPNSVVTADVESYTMVGGVPARLVRKITVEEGQIYFTR
ncbi:MAG TPA: DapH/DapD/GlmU-related protein [Candidatus Polarisedimenticolia bacterium]|jgi:galactoside O-acetyltransferase